MNFITNMKKENLTGYILELIDVPYVQRNLLTRLKKSNKVREIVNMVGDVTLFLSTEVKSVSGEAVSINRSIPSMIFKNQLI